MTREPLIYVIEDNPSNLKLVYDLLRTYGFQVAYSSDTHDVVERITNQRPDLILMDISLRNESGLDLTRKLRNDPQTSEIPIVALTAHTTEQDRANALAAGCIGFIAKPISTRQLPCQVRKYIRNRGEQFD